MIEERAEQVGVKDDGFHGRGGLMGGAVVGEKSKNRGLLAMVGGVLLLAVVAGGGFWLWDGDGTERKAQDDFCWSLLPGGKPGDGASTAECGEALETAMTGRPPGTTPPDDNPRHTADRTRVLEKVVKGYAEREIPDDARLNFANALTHYAAEVHDVLVGREAGEEAENSINLHRDDVIRFVRAVAESEEAFSVVYDAQAERVAENIGRLERDDFTEKPGSGVDAAEGVMQESGTVLGALTEIRAAAIGDSDDGERSTDIKKALIDNYEERGRPRLAKMIERRAQEAGVPDSAMHESGTRGALLIQEAGQAYTTAVGDTERILREKS